MALTRATDKIIGNSDGNLNLSGIVTASSFSGPLVPSGDVNVGNNIKLGAASGIVTATSFSGDGSNLTSLPAGLGTALSSTQTSPLNKLYYTNRVLSIASTTTVDHPTTGTGAYTQYAEIQIEDNADLIIEDGDDLIPDILGLGDNGSTGAGGLGRLRVDTITNKGANGAPNFPNGLTGTSGTFTGNLNVGGVLTYEDVTNVDSVGVVTARSGVNVSGGEIKVGAAVTVSSGGVITSGVVTATSFSGSGANLTGLSASLFSSYAIIADQKANDVDGGTFTSGDWRTRDLNTELIDPDGIVSISSNQFTLQAGTYFIKAHAPAYRVNRHMAKLYQTSGTPADIAFGTGQYTNSTYLGHTDSIVRARVTISSATTYEIRHRCAATHATSGFGNGANFGTTELYTVVEIFKEA